MNIPHSREELEREERLLRRRLREVRRQLEAYDEGEAVHVETYYEHKKRAKTAEEIAEHTGAAPEKIRDGLDAVRLADNLGEE
jgi:hypothetical protein